MSSATIRLARPDVGEAELSAVAKVFGDGMLTMGPRVAEFERLLADACGTPHAVAVSSATAALHLAMLALGVGPGDEVVVPAYTFPATANVVEISGGRAILVDVDPDTFNVRPEDVEAALTPRTKAVIPVHLFGRPVDWAGLEAIIPEGAALVEDAAGALGAEVGGRPCGSLGLMGCLSFHPRKIVTTGEGGAVTTSNPALAAAVRRLRHHGIETEGAFDIPRPGLNARLSDILCAIGIPQVERLGDLWQARERVAGWYTERLRDVALTPGVAPGDRHGWQAYVIQVDRRDDVLAALRAQGIEAQIGTHALHTLTAYRDRGAFPGAARAFDRALALPFAASMTEASVDRVAEALRTLL